MLDEHLSKPNGVHGMIVVCCTCAVLRIVQIQKFIASICLSMIKWLERARARETEIGCPLLKTCSFEQHLHNERCNINGKPEQNRWIVYLTVRSSMNFHYFIILRSHWHYFASAACRNTFHSSLTSDTRCRCTLSASPNVEHSTISVDFSFA